jgi:DNA-binding XRE family transcriptional regulator
MELYQKYKELREKLQYNQGQMGMLFGVSRFTIWRIDNGIADTIEKYATSIELMHSDKTYLMARIELAKLPIPHSLYNSHE